MSVLAALLPREDWGIVMPWLERVASTADAESAPGLGSVAFVVATIDAMLGRQLDAVLHHERFQALEARWLGVRRLCHRIGKDEDRIKLRLLDVSWREVVRDLEKAMEFDQSQMFRLVYSAEFGMPGGEPFAVLLGDYQIRHRRSKERPEDDIGALRGMAQVAAASFCPFIANAHPSLFGIDSFREFERPIDIGAAFRGPEYTAWNSLRRIEDTRFLGLTLPRILMRLPHRDDPTRGDGFVYREDAHARDGSGYLWGGAAWALGEVLIRTFAEYGWLAAIRGVERDSESGGLVTTLPVDSFWTDRRGLIAKGGVDVQLSADHERELGELGFVALTHCAGTPYAAFHGNQSVHAPPPVAPGPEKAVVEVNEKLGSMLQYIFCVSRFAHYVKVIARDKVGSFTRADEIERLLNKWLLEYATASEKAQSETQAKYPLREAHVEVREIPGKPGVFKSIVHLRPHFQLDQMTTSVKLVTELVASRSG
ncbi:MAG: type VI secretion system contractile sheath large subunit [Planctomycetota bacterium]